MSKCITGKLCTVPVIYIIFIRLFGVNNSTSIEAASGFSFLSKATDVPMKTTDLAKGDFYLQAGNTTDFNSISTNDMDRQSVNNEIPKHAFRFMLIFMKIFKMYLQ
jgi:hypothetical protein